MNPNLVLIASAKIAQNIAVKQLARAKFDLRKQVLASRGPVGLQGPEGAPGFGFLLCGEWVRGETYYGPGDNPAGPYYDVVEHAGSSWAALQETTSTPGTGYWQLVAAAGKPSAQNKPVVLQHVIAGGGPAAPNVVRVTSDISLNLTNDTILADAAISTISLTLRTATTCKGKIYNIKKIDSTANQVQILPTVAETIDGEASIEIVLPKTSLTLQSDGLNWQIL